MTENNQGTIQKLKMTYDASSGMVIHRSKMHLGLKRNFQVMPGAEWLELLSKHIFAKGQCAVHFSFRGVIRYKMTCK